MNLLNERPNTGRIHLTASRGRAGGQWLAVTEQIRQLPGVQGVQTDPQTHQVEIVFSGSAGSLVRQIHRVLQGTATN
jgi:aspartate-semialdehyde dehydrogenase